MNMIKIQLWIVVIFHFAILLCNGIALLSLPVMLPLELGWLGIWLAFPICSFIVRLVLVEKSCPLTNIENNLRKKLGERQIGTFVGHYIKRNIYYKVKNHIESSQYSLFTSNSEK